MARDRATIPLTDRTTYVYRAFGTRGELLYVGISQHWAHRLEGHRKARTWWPHVRHVEIQEFNYRSAAFAMESWAIANEHPIANTELQAKHCPPCPPEPVRSFGRFVRHWDYNGDEIAPREVGDDALVQG